MTWTARVRFSVMLAVLFAVVSLFLWSVSGLWIEDAVTGLRLSVWRDGYVAWCAAWALGWLLGVTRGA